MTVYDMAYAAGLGLSAPLWLALPRLRRKVLDALRERNGVVDPSADPRPAVLIHAVSMGEINATTALVRMLGEAQPNLRFIISTTSRTGEAQARKLYEANPRVTRIRYPFDFSRAVGRMLDAQLPAVAVLMELEVWPNFMLECGRRAIPVLLINGRLSQYSFRGYTAAGPLIRPMFKRLSLACVQEQAYADRFARLGVPAERIRVTGTMKFDTARVASRIDGGDTLARSVGLNESESVWVCGSTGPGEERIILDVYARLLKDFPTLRLVIVPRHPQRFDEVAALIVARGFSLCRRSQPSQGEVGTTPAKFPIVILGDTMGELPKFYSIAHVVFVGRTLVDLGSKQHGSDMIEPAALAKPVLVGPYTGNFAEVMAQFRKAKAMIEVRTDEDLHDNLRELIDRDQPDYAVELGLRAQQVVVENQGATARHVEAIRHHLPETQGVGSMGVRQPAQTL